MGRTCSLRTQWPSGIRTWDRGTVKPQCYPVVLPSRISSIKMMAAAHPAVSGLLLLLETLEDSSISSTEQVDAYLTISSRLSGEDGKEFAAGVGKQFTRLCEVFKTHLPSLDSELCNAALQALGFCVFHSNISAGLSELEARQLLVTLCEIAVKSTDKNTCTRALWVISKQSFCAEVVEKEVQNMLTAVETILTRDQQSMVIEHEALNLIVKLIEQTPVQMGENAVQWARLVLPLVVHSAPKVRLRAATALEMGLPLLLQKQPEVAGIIEPLMISKMIQELQKLFTTKNETYVLKLWPLFVKLLGKSLHRGGSFINSLLHLEELGFRSGSPVVKKIAFIAWKSLIDNFALNPDILCSAKRLRLLMQPLSSIHVRTEILGLAKLEVWWYLALRLGPQLSANFEQVCLPLLQNAFGIEGSVPPGTPCRTAMTSPNTTPVSTQKPVAFPSPSLTVPRLQLNSSLSPLPVIQAVQLVGVEVLLHFLVGPEVTDLVKQNKLQLSLDPLQHPLINSLSFFCKNAGTLITAVRDAFLSVGKLGEDAMLNLIWKHLISYVKNAIESGSKKERQASEVLTLLLQALQQIVNSDTISAHKTLALIEATVKGLSPKVLGSPAYQGTPALFMIILLFHNSLLEGFVVEERFFMILEMLVEYGLSGPTCSLAFSESVLNLINQSATLVMNKEHLWRMWSIVVNPLTERVTQTNEVNQGDALEHNFGAMYIALTLPINHLFSKKNFPQPTMKSLLRTWAELYKTFARCAALVATAEANVCCEELSAKILSTLDDVTLTNLSTLDAIVHVLNVMVDCVDFSQFSKFQQKSNTPHTPTHWLTKKQEPLGNLTSLLKLLMKITDAFHESSSKESQLETPTSGMVSIGVGIIAILSRIFNHLSLASAIQAVLTNLAGSISTFYERTSNTVNGTSKVYTTHLCNKLEKLYADILLCLQSRYTSSYDSDLLEQLSSLLSSTFLHKNRQIRNQTTQFWNATFAKSTVLSYPQQMKPILSQVKQKTPIILPGFEVLELIEESSRTYSDLSENSQLDAKVSGVQVNSFGKRESLLARAEELREKSSPQTPAKLKLDFSSPQMPRRELLLEEEKSIDFVFIPPEPKQRILTEHQKEVLQTKRTDIPAMYNNLDASQDSHLFSQYTQSQEGSSDNPALEAEEAEKPSEKPPQNENMETGNELDTQVAMEASSESKLLDQGTDQDLAGHGESRTEQIIEDSIDLACNGKQEEVRDVTAESMSNCTGGASELGVSSAEVSGSSTSSDIISGTPQKSSSRRQSFITLEKFDPSTTCYFSNSPLVKFAQAAAEVFVPQRDEVMEVENASQLEVDKVCQDVSLNTTKTGPMNVSVTEGKRGRRRQNKTEQSTVDKTANDIKAPKCMKSSEGESSDAKEKISTTDRNTPNKNKSDCCQATASQTNNKQTKGSVFNEDKNSASPAVVLKVKASTKGASSKQNEINANSSKILTNITLRRSSRKHLDVAVTPQTNCKEKREDNKFGTRSQNEGEEPLKSKSSQHGELLKGKENDSKTSSGKSTTEKSRTLKTDSQDSDCNKTTPAAGKVRPRYQTRRASQGLSEAENSSCGITDSENSEGNSKFQEGQKKRRTFKGKTKTKDLSLDDSKTKGVMVCEPALGSQLCSKNETVQMKGSENELPIENKHKQEEAVMTQEADMENLDEINTAQTSPAALALVEMPCAEKDHKTHSTAHHTREVPENVASAKTELGLEQGKTEEVCTVASVGSLPFEAGVSTAELSTDDCSNLSDVQLSIQKNQNECHVRSKRTRKTKNCDCCKDSSQQHGKSRLESKENSTKREPRSDDQKEHSPHLSSSIYNSSEGLLESPKFSNLINGGPCAFSTPLSGNSKIQFFGISVSTVPSEVDLAEEKELIPRIETSTEQKMVMQSSTEWKVMEDTAAKQKVLEEPLTEQKMMGDSSTKQKVVEESSTEQKVIDDPSMEQEMVEESSTEQKVMDDPSMEQEMVEESFTEQKVMDDPSMEQEMVEESSTEQKMIDVSSTKQKVVEESSTEQKMIDGSSTKQKVVEESTTEQKMIVVSSTKQKVVEESSTEQKMIDVSSTKQKVVEESSTEQKMIDGSSTKQKVVEESTTEQKMIDVSSTKQKVVEESSTEQKMIDVSSTKQKVVEESSLEQKMIDVSSTKQKVVEESSTEQKMIGDLSTKQKVVEESSAEQKVMDDTPMEQEVVEEPSPEQQMMGDTSTKQEVVEESAAERKVMDSISTEREAKETSNFGKSEHVQLIVEADGTVEVSLSGAERVSNDVALIQGEPFQSKETLVSCELDQDQMSGTDVTAPVDQVAMVQPELDQMDRTSVLTLFHKKTVQDEPITAEHFKEAVSDGNEETSEVALTAQIDRPKLMIPGCNVVEHLSEHLMESPQKTKNEAPFLLGSIHSPSEMQACCVWSPTASPSTSILKKGIKRSSENDSPSPMNKIRRVSFADPIQREGLADDIDRRSPVVRSHSSSGSSPGLNHSATNGCSKSSVQSKYNTTPTKGFLSPSTRSSGYKSSKKCLISEMSKDSEALSTAAVYPALSSCSLPVETILPQLASNMWARGLGQLVRAKNIKTIGDLSSLTVTEIKLLPIRSPKVFVVKKALKAFYEQQRKSLGLDEDCVFENEKLVNGTEDSSYSNGDDEKLATDLVETVPPAITPSMALVSEVNALSARFFSEDLNEHPGSQLFAMHQQLSSMMNCIMGNLRSRWRSSPREAAD
ncbi:telomere-associated protein RIF1 isoform X2 [Scyliorhinus torazame]|uniref:telomere-associated protein RIF1 isoform X2 n=1 Tax=Scyliorhinus torazame TaxID=75743 RepID=UPI003B5CBCB0